MVSYQVELFSEVLEEMKGLFVEQYEELDTDTSEFELNPNYEAYAQMEQAGMLHLVTVRVEGVIVGYFFSIVSPLLHSQQILNAHCDIFYVKKEHRGSDIGYTLLSFAFNKLEEAGANFVTLGVKTAHPYDALCERLGMRNIERLYVKNLG